MIVDCAHYLDGARASGTLSVPEAAAVARREPGFIWLGLHEPDDTEWDEVVRCFGLHPLAADAVRTTHQRPHCDEYEQGLAVVLKPAWYKDSVDVVELGQLVVYLADTFVITARHGRSTTLRSARERLECRPDQLSWGPTAALYAVVDHVVEEYVEVIIGLEDDIDDIEVAVFSGARADHGERIFKLKREVLDFRRAVDPLEVPLRRFARGEAPRVVAESAQWFRDVLDDLTRVSEHLQNLDSLLDSALAANVASVGMRQNEDMRKISAGAALITVPTLIAGIYGMNFDDMPELHWGVGYPFALLTMLTAVVILYWQFKKRDWL